MLLTYCHRHSSKKCRSWRSPSKGKHLPNPAYYDCNALLLRNQITKQLLYGKNIKNIYIVK